MDKTNKKDISGVFLPQIAWVVKDVEKSNPSLADIFINLEGIRIKQ